ncbi:hypothetical protein [Aurantiacibacter poecillastricola]|uniref:hypothetical protein n=1 Tax=Aurantiacibacter poecillastricola TaxID=3064385 RepID=UPI00273FFEE6|nr:hypothetical protein [Aurantiacibacter sp. 219JJ12-13]MDP5262109.1 hypothetical protein [Aurantiacibacter sp. 219JJ12-13]
MRAVLIAIPQAGEAALPVIAGKSLAHRQMLFAREAGCETVIAHGNGASPEGIALRHAAERLGMKFQVIASTHALIGIIGSEDSLLVLERGLLPESRSALDLLRAEGERVLVVSSGPGAAAGLERIDLDRAWAGALTLPGQRLGHLAGLPEDAAPQPALLRIALQNRLPEARLDDSVLDDGRWTIIETPDEAREHTSSWQRTHLGEAAASQISRKIGTALVHRFGERLLAMSHARLGLMALAVLLVGGGVVAGIYELPVLGFVLVGLGAPVVEAFLALSRLGEAPFGRIGRWPLIRRLLDAGLLALGVLAIDSLTHRVLFPPLVLVASLVLLDRKSLPPILDPLRDRMAIALVIAAIAAAVTPEIGIMLVAIAVLAANLLPSRG